MPEFVALADLLRPAPQAVPASAAVPQPAVSEPMPPERAVPDAGCDAAEAARDARLFRARLADAFDDALARLFHDLAADVLARELRLAPCDLAALARRALARAPVVRVRVAPGDTVAYAARVAAARGGTVARAAPADGARDPGMPVVADSALQPGDAVFELVGGALDARLGVRLAAVLDDLAEPQQRRGAER